MSRSKTNVDMDAAPKPTSENKAGARSVNVSPGSSPGLAHARKPGAVATGVS